MTRSVPFSSIAIFGGAGFIGSNWARYLLGATQARIHIFDNLSRHGVQQNLRWLQSEADDSKRLKITIEDIRDAGMVKKTVESASEIYHFAAQVAVTTSVSDPRTDFDVNVGGTLNILEAARKSGRRPFILFTSSNKVYGNLSSRYLVKTDHRYQWLEDGGDGSIGVCESEPLDFHSPYGCSKGAADQYVHDYSRTFDLPTVVFRMSCIAGQRQFGNEDQGWMAHFLYSALQDRPITIYGDGRQVRDVLCIDDLVRAFAAVRAHPALTAGQIYNVGGGIENSVSLLEVIEKIKKLTGKQLRFAMQAPRAGDQPFYATNFQKLHQHVGWKPRMDVSETLEALYGWWRGNQQAITVSHADTRNSSRAFQAIPEAAS